MTRDSMVGLMPSISVSSARLSGPRTLVMPSTEAWVGVSPSSRDAALSCRASLRTTRLRRMTVSLSMPGAPDQCRRCSIACEQAYRSVRIFVMTADLCPACPRAPGALGDQVQGGADDAVGVDAVIAVEVLDRPGLAELRHAQRGVRHLVDGGQERQRVRVPVQDRDQRRGPGRGERLLEDPGLAR